MAAAAMLDFGYRAFFDILYVLFMGAATFLPNLVKIGHEMRERHQFSEIQDGGNRHVGFLSPGSYQYYRMCCYSLSQHSFQIWWKLVKN